MGVAKILEQRFGIRTRINRNPLVTAVGLTLTKVLGNDPNRVSFVVVNLSANDMYFSWDKEVSAIHGVYLAPNGGSFALNIQDDFELVCAELNALAGGAASAIFVEEVLIDKVIE